jgi:hypothetical protein
MTFLSKEYAKQVIDQAKTKGARLKNNEQIRLWGGDHQVITSLKSMKSCSLVIRLKNHLKKFTRICQIIQCPIQRAKKLPFYKN